ncbi:MAG: XrtA-associated tyrosine autokinase [Cycloclasticus sp.]|jgi:receptor protein-tyrosine kinase|nr:XrtA-associated tyrosine autokinase [Cycloclasticus sp.]
MSIIEKAVEKLNSTESQEQASPSVRETGAICGSGGARIERTEILAEGVEPQASKPFLASGVSKPIDIEISFAELAERGMVTPDSPRSPIAEEYRSIKRPLLTNIEGKGAAAIGHPNLIMVTSALQGEGKTFSAINLAMSIAMEQDKTVLLVDADISKASAARLLGVPDSSPGLIDVLEDESLHIGDVILHTNIPNLRIVPAGRVHERSTELLASQSMYRVADELAERYSDRVVIFDSPPLLLTNEAQVVASLVGQIVFVIAAEKPSQRAVAEALSMLGDEAMVGMILNKTKHAFTSKYGYGYGYGYGNTREKNEPIVRDD